MVDCAASTLFFTWHVFIWRGVLVAAFRWNLGGFLPVSLLPARM